MAVDEAALWELAAIGALLKSSIHISRLLAGRDQLSATEKDAVLEHLLTAHARGEKAHRLRWSYALAAVIVLAIPLLLLRPWQEDSFTPRGEVIRPSFELSCAESPKARTCSPGQKLIFAVDDYAPLPYFAAFAKRADGAVIWYFPADPEEKSLDISRHQVEGVLNIGVLLGPEHTAGHYVVYSVFSLVPLSREQVKALFERSDKEQFDDTVLAERELEIR